MTDDESLVKKEQHSNALVTKDKDIDQVFKEWKEAGLTPVEMTEEDLTSKITIITKAHDGSLSWEVENDEGTAALGKMSVTLHEMLREYWGNSGKFRIRAATPDLKIAIQLQDNKVQMAYNHDQKTEVKGLLTACLWTLIEETQANDPGSPIFKFSGNLNFDTLNYCTRGDCQDPRGRLNSEPTAYHKMDLTPEKIEEIIALEGSKLRQHLTTLRDYEQGIDPDHRKE